MASSSSSLSATGVSQLSTPSGKTTLDYSKWDLIEDEVCGDFHTPIPFFKLLLCLAPSFLAHADVESRAAVRGAPCCCAWCTVQDDLPQPGEGLPMPKGADPKHGLPHYADRQAHHDESMKVIAEWCKEAYPRQSDEELRQTVAFVAVQHRGIHPTNVMRHLEIVAFLDKAEKKGTLPELHALIALAKHAQKKMSDEKTEADLKAQAERVFMVAMQALNTLAACTKEGGARKLFDECLNAPMGEVSRAYIALRYALDNVTSPPKDPRDIKEEEESDKWWADLWVWFTKPSTLLVIAVIVGMLAYAISLVPEEVWERLAQPPPEHGMGGGMGMGGAPRRLPIGMDATPAAASSADALAAAASPPGLAPASGLGVPGDVLEASAASDGGWQEVPGAAA
jgi:hypothetical protein